MLRCFTGFDRTFLLALTRTSTANETGRRANLDRVMPTTATNGLCGPRWRSRLQAPVNANKKNV